MKYTVQRTMFRFFFRSQLLYVIYHKHKFKNLKRHKLKSYPLWFCCAFSLRSRVKRQNLPISSIWLTQWQATSIQLVCRRIHLDGLHSQTAVSRVVRCIYLYLKGMSSICQNKFFCLKSSLLLWHRRSRRIRQ